MGTHTSFACAQGGKKFLSRTCCILAGTPCLHVLACIMIYMAGSPVASLVLAIYALKQILAMLLQNVAVMMFA